MKRQRGRIIPIVIALGAVWFITRNRETSESPSIDGAPDTGRYVATVQQGLGASVAILLDQSGSMKDRPASGGEERKYRIARRALAEVLAQTDSFVSRQPGFLVNVGLYTFDSDVETVLPIAPFNRQALDHALEQLRSPRGSTAIGDAMSVATADLYRAGTIRKYLLVVTDGENTTGRAPESVAREIARRSEGAVKVFLVAFDVDAEKFAFVNDVRGTVIEARNASALRAGLDTLYRGRILAEAMDAGETLPLLPPSDRSTPAGAAPATPPSRPR
ncbi:MAG: VWA domain-containing protein [Gemmatimonadota bacterium]